ncbi:3'-5' RNA helicase YTHDC2 isoform X2 [Corythoichthys intestinalis]|uniref:3'-5' RNA helicase YTHDC2 isoform X2 n=1 Tax=Corythoichthys intestinalis TaxID=161448 RepID=UPI0025A56852|nr:3'-5' RNA helicase YTHDC2 isoform X2 [Corythoichthys intestinalis]
MSQKGAKSRKTKKSTVGRFKDIHIGEEVKIAINLSLERFRYGDQNEMEFPSSLTSEERAYIHLMAQALGYISKSKGKNANRFLTIRKKSVLDSRRSTMCLALSQTSLHDIRRLLKTFPITRKEREELRASSKSKLTLATQLDNSFDVNRPSGRLNCGVSAVPLKRRASELDRFRCSLPVYEHEQEIVRLIRENRVVLVIGETGSGKTTQIPQFILDDCSKKGQCCQIFCTQPRRLAAITVAERVAAERGETIGKTVGYHIRLESRVSPNTLLTFCTTGVLLRTLMSGDVSLTTVTHVIVDEVHERDGLTDFLLTKMLDVLQEIPTIKLILSSASLDVDLFLKYFAAWSCPVIHLKGRQFEVKQQFLEDILRFTGFNRKNSGKHNDKSQRKEETPNLLTNQCKTVEKTGAEEVHNAQLASSDLVRSSDCAAIGESNKTLNLESSEQMEPWLQKEMDSCIANIFISEDQGYIVQLFNLILYENVNVNYMHSERMVTPLMVAASRGLLPQIEQLLNLGADVNLKALNGWTALDFAKNFEQFDAVELLQNSIALKIAEDQKQSTMCATAEQSTKDQDLLKLYHHNFNDEFVDLNLIMDLLHKICSTTTDGAVLIFLPGYDEIMSLKDRILYSDTRFSACSERYQVFTLHSDMPSYEQKKAMKTSPLNVRKIILSTNIAETSITINDVVFVIDSGKVKEKSFDTISRISMLKAVWISKASALQRRGRAGRCQPGICFHLFSQLRFNSLQEFQVPQLLRMPLQELCLQTKLLTSSPVAEFLSKAPQPPTAHAVKSAVEILKTIEAMNQNEDLTDLGFHLADLPVEPHLGKMVLCAVVLKCLDPILTIACTLGYRDPFVLPALGFQKKAAFQCRKHFSANSFSDHMALLRVFQEWQKACTEGRERSFCEKNFLSNATMEMILGMRTQLLGRLRATGFVRAHGESDIRDVNVNSEKWPVVKAALVAGMYPNLLHINPENNLPSSNKEKKVNFHPTSTLNSEDGKSKLPQALPADWVVYDEMSRGHRIASVRCCTLVTAITVVMFAGGSRNLGSDVTKSTVQQDSLMDDMSDSDTEDSAEMRIDDWLVFQTSSESAELMFDLRSKWHNLFISRICSPYKPWSKQDEMTLQTLVSVLTTEEHAAGLKQPSGIGQRPFPFQHSENSRKLSWNGTNDRKPAFPGLHPKKPQSSNKPTLGKKHLTAQGHPYGSSASSLSMETPSGSPLSLFSGKHCTKDLLPQQGFSSVRYFVMKSSNKRNIEISKEKGIWSTSPGSGHFQGYGRMSSTVSHNSCYDWGFGQLGGVFGVEWLCKESLPFHCTHHIINPLNENKKVQISRDGQELYAHTGRQLLSLWEKTPKVVANS